MNKAMEQSRSPFKPRRTTCIVLVWAMITGLPGFGLLQSCKEVLDLPEEKEYLSPNINYATKVLEPVLGRTTIMGGFNSDNSTLPLTFEIVNARWGDGRPVTDLFQTRPTWVWTTAYDGYEESLEEINAKRELAEKPLFEVRESGEFILWASSTNELIEPRPADSSDLSQDIRYFDLKVSNSGGEVLLRDFQIRPWRERHYEPSNDINPYTGDGAPDPLDPNNPFKRDFIRPWLNNVIGVNTEQALQSNDQVKDVVVFIEPFEGGNGHSLRFRFVDTEDKPISPDLFNETDWERLVHGFNMEKTLDYVQYDVAYPIPLVHRPTPYTNGTGSHASVEFSYSRLGFGGVRTTSAMGLDFQIFREGDWEIIFKFRNDNPKFEDE